METQRMRDPERLGRDAGHRRSRAREADGSPARTGDAADE